jgi:guanine nucleotide-binding protein subunit beta-like protein 1
LKAGSSPITFVSTDSDILLSQDRAGVIKIWDLEKSGYVKRLEINTNYLGFARAQHIIDKNLLVAPSSTSDISVIDLTTGNEIQSLKPPAEDIQQLTSIKVIPWCSDDVYLLAGYESGHLVLFDLKQSKAVHQLKYDFPITTLDYDLSSNRGLLGGPTNVTVCAFGIDKMTLELYRKEAETIEYIPNDGQKLAGISDIKIRPDKKCLIIGTCDGIVYIHSCKSLRKFATLRNHRGEISEIAFSKGAIDSFKSPIMAVAGIDGNISLWDIYYK